MEREMNFFDLCVACARAIGRACRWCGGWLAGLLRLTFRMWWTVIPVTLLVIGGGYYYSRIDNLKFKVQGVAMLNGAGIEQFEERYRMLQTAFQLSDQEPLKGAICEQKISGFETFCVVDALGDGVADYVDYARKSSPTDTVKVQMKDRMAIQFQMKYKDLGLIPEIEKQLLAFFNADEAMQKSYALYVKNLARELQFNHDQVEKLDSLTSEYYFHNLPGSDMIPAVKEGMLAVGDRKIHLFLNDIYEQHARTEQMDYRASFVTAPVTFENHLVVNPKAANSRRTMLPLSAMVGWLLGCCLAAMIEQRKRIISWLKK
ncbi:MAG: hypothetical protein IJ718_01690 [Paludibacteraceae bacterium]|nr:hypothetical protein [Paludibacteraceae bacterium]